MTRNTPLPSDASVPGGMPSPITHSEFTAGVGKTIGYSLRDGTFALSKSENAIFIAYWLLYMIGPLFVVPFFAYRWQAWNVLWGLVASYAGSLVAARTSKRDSFSAILLVLMGGAFISVAFHAPFGSWFSIWFSNWFVFFCSCALWGSFWFSVADAAQETPAMAKIMEDPKFYAKGLTSGKLIVFRFGELGASMATKVATPPTKRDRTPSPDVRHTQDQIASVVETIYSEQFDLEAMVERLAPTGAELSQLRAHIAIQVGTQLKAPLTQSDVEFALERLKDATQCQGTPEFGEILDCHKMLATWTWMRRNLRILQGKLAQKQDENSVKGALYEHERRNRGPLDAEMRQKVESLSNEITSLDETIRERELEHLREGDPEEYTRYEKETSDWKAEIRSDADKQEETEFEVAGWISEQEVRLAALLSKARATLGPVEAGGPTANLVPDSPAEPTKLTELLTASDSFDSASENVAPFSARAENRRLAEEARRELGEPAKDSESDIVKHNDVIADLKPSDFEPYTCESLDGHTKAMEALSIAFQTVADKFKRFLPSDEGYELAAKFYGTTAELFDSNAWEYGHAARFALVDASQGNLDALKAAVDRLIDGAADYQAGEDMPADRILEEAQAHFNALEALGTEAKTKAEEYRLIAAVAQRVARRHTSEDDE